MCLTRTRLKFFTITSFSHGQYCTLLLLFSISSVYTACFKLVCIYRMLNLCFLYCMFMLVFSVSILYANTPRNTTFINSLFEFGLQSNIILYINVPLHKFLILRNLKNNIMYTDLIHIYNKVISIPQNS